MNVYPDMNPLEETVLDPTSPDPTPPPTEEEPAPTKPPPPSNMPHTVEAPGSCSCPFTTHDPSLTVTIYLPNSHRRRRFCCAEQRANYLTRLRYYHVSFAFTPEPLLPPSPAEVS